MNKSILLKITIALFAIIFSFNAKAQSPTFTWVDQFTGSNNQSGVSLMKITTDNAGNVYVIGAFEAGGSVDLDPGAGTLNVTSTGLRDVFFGKYASNGNLLWAYKLGSAGNEDGLSIGVDNSGNVFIAGAFKGTIDFDPGAGVANMTNASGGSDLFIAKYSSSGNYISSFTIPTFGSPVIDMIIDNNNDVIVAGDFSNATTDFDPGAGVFNLGASGQDGFIAKYSNSLSFMWAGLLNATTIVPTRMRVDNLNNIFMCGYFSGGADIDPGLGAFNISTVAGSSIFFAKYNASGNFVWGKTVSNPASSFNYAYDLALDNSKNIYLVGDINQYAADFDPSASVFNLTGNGYDGYLAKYDSLGNFNWAFKIGGTTSLQDAAYSVDVDVNNNPVVIGAFKSTCDFDPGVGVINLSSSGQPAYAAKYSSAGAYIWAFSLESFGGGVGAYSCDISSSNYLHVFGAFNQTVDFDPAAPTVNLSATPVASQNNVYIAKYEAGCTLAPAQPISISGSTSICSGSSNTYSVSAVAGATSYTWSLPGGWSGTSTTNSISTTASATSGNITVTANNACGNSSAQTLLVTVNTIPATPGTISGTTTICSGSSNTYSVSAVAGATSYTWSLPGGWSGTSTTNTISTTASATSGNVTVTANNACGNSSAQTLSVTVNTIPATPGTISGLSSMCVGAGASTYSITSVVGATSYAWSLPIGWSGASTSNSISATAGSSGTISVTASNTCGTSATQNLSVTINALPTIVYTQNPDTVCANAGNIALGSVTPIGGTFSGTAVTGTNFNATTAGAGTFTITYTYTDANSCTNTASQNILVDLCTGLSNQTLAVSSFIVFPNPANELVTITTNENKGQLIIYNTLGAVLYSQQLNAAQTTVDVSAYQSGIYFIQLQTVNGMATKKIIKQ